MGHVPCFPVGNGVVVFVFADDRGTQQEHERLPCLRLANTRLPAVYVHCHLTGFAVHQQGAGRVPAAGHAMVRLHGGRGDDHVALHPLLAGSEAPFAALEALQHVALEKIGIPAAI
ncbi:unnamed protein product, partial [Urochloa humidicola]